MINFLKSLEINYDIVIVEMTDAVKMRVNGIHEVVLNADNLIANGTKYPYPENVAELYRILWIENITFMPKK